MKRYPKYPKALRSNPIIYHETIITMMRYGGAVDQIARDLGLTENSLVTYIKKEEIDKKLHRRSWKWKAQTRKRRMVGSYRSRGNRLKKDENL